MRLNPEGYLRVVQSKKFEVTYAGSGDSFGGGLIYNLVGVRSCGFGGR